MRLNITERTVGYLFLIQLTTLMLGKMFTTKGRTAGMANYGSRLLTDSADHNLPPCRPLAYESVPVRSHACAMSGRDQLVQVQLDAARNSLASWTNAESVLGCWPSPRLAGSPPLGGLTFCVGCQNKAETQQFHDEPPSWGGLCEKGSITASPP